MAIYAKFIRELIGIRTTPDDTEIEVQLTSSPNRTNKQTKGDFLKEVQQDIDTHIHAPFAGAGTTGFVPDPGSERDRVLGDDGEWKEPLKGTLFQVARPDENSYKQGQEWVRTSDFVKFTLHVDVDSRQWVRELNGSGPIGPPGPVFHHLLNTHHDVKVPTPSDGELIRWDAAQSLWVGVSTTPTFISPTLSAGWSNAGALFQGARYWKDLFGVVHLEGYVTSAGPGARTEILVLGVGFRPVANHTFSTNITVTTGSTVTPTSIAVAPSGQVALIGGLINNQAVSLSGITFQTG